MCEKRNGVKTTSKSSSSNSLLHVLGLILLIAGALILIIFLPVRFWISLLGVALLVAGLVLLLIF